MPKLATAFELTLPPREAGLPAYRWLYGALRTEILEGRLRPGARLPATRDLAGRYALSRGTVVTAFEQLRSEGYIAGTVGSGSYVSKVLPDDLLTVARQTPSRPAARPAARRLSAYANRVASLEGTDTRPVRAFRANLPAVDLFPATLWAQVMARRWRKASAKLLLGCDPLGYVPLREAVADYLNTARGTKCTLDQVLIVSGMQEAFDLVTRLVVNPGDRVGVETPGYPSAFNVFAAAGAKIVALPIDDEGVKVPGATARDLRIVYVTPAHQCPTGITMSLPRRLALLEWARRARTLIFEDDYDSEYRYSGRPIPTLQGLDNDGLVLLAGTFSKVLFSSLRLGYLVVPPDLIDLVTAAKSLSSRHTHLLEQAVLCDFMTEGHFGRHLRRMREAYAERLGVLVEEANAHLDGVLTISRVEAGLQTVGWLREGLDAEAVAKAASAHNLEVVPLSRYGSSGRAASRGLQLGFACLDPREIRRGVRDLAVVLETVGAGRSYKA